ncbi:unnamed protein product [Soboliphyme baturini]|uniref:Dynein light chain n=1 Tax=Soboliphyme baturini TaxID=241478 RepID=A0A183IMS7_9BILA|nr:unnamed protein product [Soboliphyme baturini]
MEYHTKIRWQKQPENQMGNILFGGHDSEICKHIAWLFEQILVMITDVKTEWQLTKSVIMEAAAECCGFKWVGLPVDVRKDILLLDTRGTIDV